MATQPPVTNRRAAEKAKAANAIHLQEQLKASEMAKKPPVDPSTLSKLGAQFTGAGAAADTEAALGAAQREATDIGREFKQSQLEQQEANLASMENLDRSIIDQQNELVGMNIGITEDIFANDQSIQRLERDGRIENETELLDLARLVAQNDEEFASYAQEMDQAIREEIDSAEWELKVYERALDEETLYEGRRLDNETKNKIRAAKAAAERKAQAAREKAGKFSKAVGAAKIVAGAGITYASGGTAAGAGGALAASGVSDVAGA